MAGLIVVITMTGPGRLVGLFLVGWILWILFG